MPHQLAWRSLPELRASALQGRHRASSALMTELGSKRGTDSVRAEGMV